MTHDHDHVGSAAWRSRRRLAAVLALTSVYLLVEVGGALWTKSLALLAEAGHMLMDTAGLALALLAIRFAERPATPERTYGYHRVEILAALANAVVLVSLSLYVLVEAVERLRNPPAVASGPMLAVAVAGFFVNLAGMALLRKGSRESLSVKSAYLEVLSDMVSALGVIAAALVMWVTRWYYADPLVSAAIGVFILPRTWHLLKEAVGVLLEGTPSHVNLAALRRAISGLEGVAGVHDLHVWTLTSGMNAMSLHVVIVDGAAHDDVLAAVKEQARCFEVTHVTIQVERLGCAAGETHA